MTLATAQRRVLARADTGRTLDASEVATLLALRDDGLAELVRIAGRLRDQGLADAGRPGVVTWSRKVFVPLTRLCRDRCHYCTFATAPGNVPEPFLAPDEVLAIAQQGAAQECKEALFTLGDRPELRWRQARQWLAGRGYSSTLEYLRAMAVLVLERTGLLPHLNPGVMTWQELQRLKPVAASMGLMLENTSERLYSTPGLAHHGSPDKQPQVRLRTIEDTGRCAIPFTTGLLVGIGETVHERAETLLALRRLHRAHGHVQEVIVQNFRAKARTPMRDEADLDIDEYVATVATTRVVLGSAARVQAPPNLSEPHTLHRLLDAGVDDWGGVSPVTSDHVNPERPWPQIDELALLTAQSGLLLRERLAVHPSYVLRGEPWLDRRVQRHVDALAGPDGLAIDGARPVGRPWQEPDAAWPASPGRTSSPGAVGAAGRGRHDATDAHGVHGNWDVVRDDANVAAPAALVGDAAVITAALRRAAQAPQSLLDDRHTAQALALFEADGAALGELVALADERRRAMVGDTVTYVVNRNINFTNVCYTGCRFCAFAQRRSDADAYTLSLDEVGERAAQAWAAGATEVCMQGGIDPALPVTAYQDLVRAVKQRVPQMHVHAFSPMEIATGAARADVSIERFLAALRDVGLDTIPGTAAEILDDDVRWVLTKGKLPTAAWIEVVTTAHRLGLRSSSTMMYGHVDAPRHWLQHLRVLASVQDVAVANGVPGFTEFVPLPFVHTNAPIYLAGVARPGPTARDNTVVHAMGRLLLVGRIDHVQTSWVKLGVEGTQRMLRAGADDLGGTLMDETISRMAGAQHGSAKSAAELVAIAHGAGRPAQPRTTTYAQVNGTQTGRKRRCYQTGA